MTQFDISNAILPVLDQLARNEGATIALAKQLLSKEDFEVFLEEQDIQVVHTWKSLVEKFDYIFDDVNQVSEDLDNRLEKLKQERDAL